MRSKKIEPTQRLLLSALSGGAESAVMFERWAAVVDLNSLDLGSYRLLPLLYLNLTRQGVDHPLLPMLKDEYRRSWARNQHLITSVMPGVQALTRAGIPVVLLKGVAMIAAYYRDIGARDMDDFDVLLPPESLRLAATVLAECGWSLGQHPKIDFYDRRFFHSLAFRNERGRSLDVHFELTWSFCGSSATALLWRDLASHTLLNEEVSVLGPTGSFLNVCIHGVAWNEVPSIRWIADALTILAGRPDGIDWEFLFELACESKTTLHLASALTCLKEEFSVEIPSTLLDRCRSRPTPFAHRRVFELQSTDQLLHPLNILRLHWYIYCRGLGECGLLTKLREFSHYSRFVCQTDSRWGMLGFVFKKMAALYKKALFTVIGAGHRGSVRERASG